MSIYINGIGSVSAQQLDTRAGVMSFDLAESNRMSCKEPDYSGLVPPMQLRRMSKVVRYGVAAAKQALKDAGLERSDIITLGTAYGCLADTEVFLSKLLTQEESMLTPTAFIQSTHNTVSGQIALLTNCYGHNFTYVHRGHSFETALQEAMMWLKEKSETLTDENFSVLTGGIDELTNDSFDIILRFGTFKKEQDISIPGTEGTIAGEGANLFVVSQVKNEQSYAEVMDMHLCYSTDIQTELLEFLRINQLQAEEIDTCLIGVNGDSRYDESILGNIAALKQAQWLAFKQWSGEYPTSNAFGMALACMVLKHQQIPDEVYHAQTPSRSEKAQNVLLYNHYKNKYHSFILLKRI